MHIGAVPCCRVAVDLQEIRRFSEGNHGLSGSRFASLRRSLWPISTTGAASPMYSQRGSRGPGFSASCAHFWLGSAGLGRGSALAVALPDTVHNSAKSFDE